METLIIVCFALGFIVGTLLAINYEKDIYFNSCAYKIEKELLRTEYEKGRADAIAERQKSTWSEDDELMFLSTIQSIEMTNGAAQLKIDWLKSLKDRCTWKPDDEQLKAIKWIMDGDNPENWTVTLTKLYNDLKKL